MNYWPSFNNKALVYVRALSADFEPSVGDSAVGSAAAPAISLTSSPNALLSRELPIVAGNYDALSMNGGRLHAFLKTAMRDDSGHLVALPVVLNGPRRTPQRVFRDTLFKYAMSKDGRALVAVGPQGLVVAGTDATGKFGEAIPLNSVSGLELDVDLVRERAQMFGEFWRLYRDYFWDAGMAGVDWVAIRDKYVGLLPKVSNRAEFNELVSCMVAELGAGHTAIGNASARAQDGGSVGKLGATFADDDGLRVVDIYDGDLDVTEERSPLSIADSPVEVGDRIRRVNGLPVVNRVSLDHLLNGKVGATVILTVEKPNGRMVDVRVSPITADHEAWLRRQSWAAGNQKYVDQVSNSRVGYIHLSASYEADFAKLVRQYPSLHQRQALILDLRGNNGGNMDPWILHFFQRRTWLYVQDRNDAMVLKHPRESFDGQLVVLIDGDTYSDGELIAEGVRRLRLGVLVGTRTSGAGKWVNSEKTLVDGGNVRIPQSGSYAYENGKKAEVIEGRGVAPDVIVENDPHHFFFGRDDQLKTAVEIALKSPRKK